MTRDNMIVMLSETLCVSPEAAETALDAKDGDVLAAARLLQLQAQEKRLEDRERRRGWRLGRLFAAADAHP